MIAFKISRFGNTPCRILSFISKGSSTRCSTPKSSFNGNTRGIHDNGADNAIKMASNTYKSESYSSNTEGSPIVIVHGLLGCKTNWTSMAKSLLASTTNRRVLTVDLRNHGDSEHTDKFNYKVMASDLTKFLNDQEISKASLIGHSLGGRVCMLVATLYPNLVDCLTVVDISPISDSPNMRGNLHILEAIKALKIDRKLSPFEARRIANKELMDLLKDKNVVNFILTNLVETQGSSGWRWRFNLDSILKNYQSEICNFPKLQGVYNGPTLFIAGGNSDYMKVEQEPMIRKIFPTAQFSYIPGAGHWVHAEKHVEFAQLASAHLNQSEQKSP